MSFGEHIRELVIVGGGPAGTALLIAASRMGMLEKLAGRGLAVVERGSVLGGGALGDYGITGDSTAETFLSAVAPSAGPALVALASNPAACSIAARIGPDGGQPVPLVEVSAFLDMVGNSLAQRVTEAGGEVLTGWQALHARQGRDKVWSTVLADEAGRSRTLVSRNVLIATGGYQTEDRVKAEVLAGRTLSHRCGDKLIASNIVLSRKGGHTLSARLSNLANPRVVIIGSSTSALAACRVALDCSQASVTLLHRRYLRLFYPSAAAALKDGYCDFGEQDICPVSGFVYRLAGFRLEARDLVMRALRVGGRTPHPRLHMHRMSGPDDQAAAQILDDADLVVHALGYQPRGLPILDAGGQPLRLASDTGGNLVDDVCRVRAASGRPIDGLFGLGLAAGFVPSGRLGGEPSFSGQANGLWLWQNDAGAAILNQLCRQPELAAA